MESKYKIKEEKVSYVVGYSLDGNPEFSSSVRYIVYEGGYVAKFTDSDFKSRDAIFPTLEMAVLFVDGKIGRLKSREVDISCDATRITKDDERDEIICPNGDRYSLIETRWNDNKDRCDMDYEKLYKEALERAREELCSGCFDRGTVVYIFPELKESEDERIRKDLINFVEQYGDNYYGQLAKAFALAWLEKQGEQKETPCDKCKREQPRSCQDIIELGRCAIEHEQKPVNKAEPKVGDWVVVAGKVAQILYIQENHTVFHDINGKNFLSDYPFYLWTIQDAKDGDVLVASDDSIFIFKEIVDCGCKHYIAIEKDNETINVNYNLKHYWEAAIGVKPATKEQRDILFQKMKEAGYEWDSEKKELKKIDIKK